MKKYTLSTVSCFLVSMAHQRHSPSWARTFSLQWRFLVVNRANTAATPFPSASSLICYETVSFSTTCFQPQSYRCAPRLGLFTSGLNNTTCQQTSPSHAPLLSLLPPLILQLCNLMIHHLVGRTSISIDWQILLTTSHFSFSSRFTFLPNCLVLSRH